MTAPASRRLFIGLIPPDAVRDRLLEWRDRWQWPAGAARVPAAHLHLTLHFLGEVAEDRLPPIQAALARVPIDPFQLRLGTPGLWRHGLAVVCPDPDARLDALRESTGAALAQAGGAGDEPTSLPWRAHVTLARRAPGARSPEGAELDLSWPVEGFALVWSRLPPQVPQPRYEVLSRWPA